MEQIEMKLKNIKYSRNLITDLKSCDMNNPEYLESLMWSAYFFYVLSDVKTAKEILNKFCNCQFDGNYDKWTWIRGGIMLLSRIYREENNERYKELIKKELATYDIGKTELSVKIKKKALKRRLAGSLLAWDKIKDAEIEKDDNLLVMSLLANLSELIYMRELGGSDDYPINKLDSIIEETINKIKTLINPLAELN